MSMPSTIFPWMYTPLIVNSPWVLWPWRIHSASRWRVSVLSLSVQRCVSGKSRMEMIYAGISKRIRCQLYMCIVNINMLLRFMSWLEWNVCFSLRNLSFSFLKDSRKTNFRRWALQLPIKQHLDDNQQISRKRMTIHFDLPIIKWKMSFHFEFHDP